MFNKKTTVFQTNLPSQMIFGIFEDNAGNIWYGSNGVYCYNGNTITDFKVKDGQK
ncbi:MAG TPA: two-component regulator propeller domain-containing protein [Cytophagales bacterium]|nr:two-component regulator propeller domain-containing protein [Cytophagales bacterium]